MLMQPVVSAVVRVRKAHAGAEVVCARALGEAIPPWLGSSDMAVDPDQFVNPALKSSAKTDVEPATETSSESALRGPSFDPSLADTAYVCVPAGTFVSVNETMPVDELDVVPTGVVPWSR